MYFSFLSVTKEIVADDIGYQLFYIWLLYNVIKPLLTYVIYQITIKSRKIFYYMAIIKKNPF